MLPSMSLTTELLFLKMAFVSGFQTGMLHKGLGHELACSSMNSCGGFSVGKYPCPHDFLEAHVTQSVVHHLRSSFWAVLREIGVMNG